MSFRSLPSITRAPRARPVRALAITALAAAVVVAVTSPRDASAQSSARQVVDTGMRVTQPMRGMQGMQHGAMQGMGGAESSARALMDLQTRVVAQLELHRRMMADPVIRERVMADTAMRRLATGVTGAGAHAGMNMGDSASSGAARTSGMSGMDHGNMPGMGGDSSARAGGGAAARPATSARTGGASTATPAPKAPARKPTATKPPATKKKAPADTGMAGMDHSKMPGMGKKP